MSDPFSKVVVITGVARRRRFPTKFKLAVVAETMQPGMSVSYVARQHGLSPSLVFRRRQLMSEGRVPFGFSISDQANGWFRRYLATRARTGEGPVSQPNAAFFRTPERANTTGLPRR